MNRKPGLATPLTLPCGAVVPNRLVKAAMTEGLATPGGVPTGDLNRLYALWSDGGAGLLLSGNVLVDRNHLERWVQLTRIADKIEAISTCAAAVENFST